MAPEGEYEPSTWDWVRKHVELYERTGGAEGTTLRGSGILDVDAPVIVVTMVGRNSGKIRKAPVMRVEHDGQYALVASKGGDPKHPDWYFNLLACPGEVSLRDGTEVFPVSVRELDGEERDTWWARAVEAWPPYEEYQAQTNRRIPVLLALRN